MNVVAIVVSAVSLTLSLFMCIYGFLTRRTRFNISVLDYNKAFKRVLLLYVQIDNLADSSLVISSIAISNDGVISPCTPTPSKVKALYNKRGTEVIDEIRYFTAQFPLNLSPKSSTGCYLQFLDAQDIQPAAGKTLVFQVSTNRRMVTKEIVLEHKGRYPHNK